MPALNCELSRTSLSRRIKLHASGFVPTFTRLAEQFLGLPISIDLEARQNEVTLLLTVRGDRRRQEDALSESCQRFFLDIALRMALVAELSHPTRPA